MNSEAIVTLVIGVCGLAAGWGAWVSSSIFKHQQEIALIKQEIRLLGEVKEVLIKIQEQLAMARHKGE